jgi:hypothetical protein
VSREPSSRMAGLQIYIFHGCHEHDHPRPILIIAATTTTPQASTHDSFQKCPFTQYVGYQQCFFTQMAIDDKVAIAD